MRDVECKADCTKLSLDQASMTPVSPDDEDDYKHGGEVHPSRIKRRTTHRPRTRPNAKSRNSTRGDKADRASPVVRISNETDLHGNKYGSVDVPLWNRTGDAQIYVRESLDDYYPFHGGLESLLARLIKALENNSREDTSSSSTVDASGFDDEDRCQKWLDNREKIERAFPGKKKNETS